MKLYCTPGTVSAAAVIAAHEAGVAVDLVRVDFARAEQTQDAYKAVNPKGRVPALETERGVLTETAAILEYLAPDLVPADRWAAGQMRAVMSYLASTMHVNHAHKMRGTRWASEEASFADMAANVTRSMTESCAYLEAHAIRGPWVLGESYSLADMHLLVVASWAEGDGVPLAEYPKLAAHQAAMLERDAVTRTIADGMLPQFA